MTEYANALRRFLIDMDVAGMRRLHAHVWPHYPQPETDEDAIYSMHLARVQLTNIPQKCREYSQQWLTERQGMQGKAVGVASLVLSDDPFRKERGRNRQAAMLDAVDECIKAGIDIDTEAPEVRRRMQIARLKA